MQNTKRLLELALKGLEADRARIDDEITQIRKQLIGGPGLAKDSAPMETGVRRRRTMSAAARKRISEGMKRRYAAIRSAIESPSQKKPAPTAGLSAAGRKKLSEAMKARWAAKKKAGKKAA